MGKGPLNSTTTKDKGKVTITAIKYSTLDRAILFSFYNHSQPLWVWADRTSISPKRLNLHVDVGGRVKTSIKREVSNLEKGLGKKAKNRSLPGRAEEKDFLGKHGLPLCVHHVPRRLNLHVDVGGRKKASIKRKDKQFREGGDKSSPRPWSHKKGE